jgi:outer membrane lipoprotein-sorting protein
MKTLAILLLLSSTALAQTTTQTVRNPLGQTTGTITTDQRGNSTFRDAMGRETGRAVVNGNNTTIYNPLGQQTGTVRSNGK